MGATKQRRDEEKIEEALVDEPDAWPDHAVFGALQQGGCFQSALDKFGAY